MVNGSSVFVRSCTVFLIWLWFCVGSDAQILPTKAVNPEGPQSDSARVRQPVRDSIVSREIIAYSAFRPWQKSFSLKRNSRNGTALIHWTSSLISVNMPVFTMWELPRFHYNQADGHRSVLMQVFTPTIPICSLRTALSF